MIELKVLIKGGGDIASGVAHRLFHSQFKVCLTEIPEPMAVRREVAFCEAVYEGEKEVEGVVSKLISSPDDVYQVWQESKIPLIIDPEADIRNYLKPDVLIDATIAKRNLGTRISDAPLVIGLGFGFQAGKDVHVVVETYRGHYLGSCIYEGEAEADTGIPGEIAGVSFERVIRAPEDGCFLTVKGIGDYVQAGDIVAKVDGTPVKAMITGIIRGLLRDGMKVYKGMKAGDIDPRGIRDYCYTISDKARAIAGGVLEAILARFND